MDKNMLFLAGVLKETNTQAEFGEQRKETKQNCETTKINAAIAALTTLPCEEALKHVEGLGYSSKETATIEEAVTSLTAIICKENAKEVAASKTKPCYEVDETTKHKVVYLYGVPVLIEDSNGTVIFNLNADSGVIVGESKGAAGWAIETKTANGSTFFEASIAKRVASKLGEFKKTISGVGYKVVAKYKGASKKEAAIEFAKGRLVPMISDVSKKLKAAKMSVELLIREIEDAHKKLTTPGQEYRQSANDKSALKLLINISTALTRINFAFNKISVKPFLTDAEKRIAKELARAKAAAVTAKIEVEKLKKVKDEEIARLEKEDDEAREKAAATKETK